MTAIRNDQGQQSRTPPQRDHDAAAANKINGARTALEGEIRDLVRRNVSQLHPSDAATPQRQGERPARQCADQASVGSLD